MKRKKDSVYLRHILDSCQAIESYTFAIGESDFFSNQMRQDAVLRQIGIVGEAVKKISVETRNAYPEIRWRDVAGMRDKIIHDYFEVDLKIVWLTATQDIPAIKERLAKVLESVLAAEQHRN